jgi:hypothetical protein
MKIKSFAILFSIVVQSAAQTCDGNSDDTCFNVEVDVPKGGRFFFSF